MLHKSPGGKKNATIYSCLPPLLLHWSSGSLSDLLKGTDQNNCSVQKNMTHSSPRTVWWLQSNSVFFFFLQMTDGTCGLSLTSPFFRLRGRDSFDLILICLRYTKGITNVTIQLSNIPWEAGTALGGTWGTAAPKPQPINWLNFKVLKNGQCVKTCSRRFPVWHCNDEGLAWEPQQARGTPFCLHFCFPISL